MFVFFTWILYPVPRAHFLKPERANSMQCSLVTAFSPASLFLKRFWRECRISFWFHRAVSKTRRPEKCQKWYFKWLLIFLCRILYFILMGSFRSEASISVWKSALKFNLRKQKTGPCGENAVTYRRAYYVSMLYLFGFLKENWNAGKENL